MRNGLFVFGIAMMVLAGALSATLSVESYSVTPSTLSPGGQGSVTFSVKNSLASGSTSATTLENVQVFFANAEGMEFQMQSPFMIGTIESGGSALVSVPFRVLPTAQSGVITAAFFISQKADPGLKTLNANIQVVNPPIITLSSDHQTVLTSDVINMTITNNGGAANKMTLRLANDSNFSLSGISEIYVGDVTGSKSVLVPIDSRKASEGVNTMEFVLAYQQEGGDSVEEAKYLSIAVKKEKADVAFTQLAPLVTNKENVLSMKIVNRGRALENFRVLPTDANVKALESTQISLGDLASGAEKEFSIPVFVDEQPGVKDVSFTLRWVEEDVEKEENVEVTVAISSDAEVGIYLEAKPTPVSVGGDYTLSATISNLGSYKIANVVVALQATPAFDILNIQKEQYIGNLDSDAFSTVQYKIRVNGVTPGEYPLSFGVKYKDQSGLWTERNMTTSITIRPAAAQGSDSTLLLLGGAVVVVGAGVWYFKFRKQKK